MSESKKKLYPFKFKKISDVSPVEEKLSSEECKCKEIYNIADLGYIDSEIENGWLADSSISDLMETYIDRVVGDNVYSFYGRQFPLQVKWIESKGSLPLMVCPDDEIASQRYDALGKKKLWYIVEADPDSKIYLGFLKSVSAESFYNKCIKGSIKEDLNVIVPKPGERYVIMPGTVHSLSGKMKILEISESSNLDLKLSSWTPARENDELNIEAAIDFVDMGKYELASSRRGKVEGIQEKLASEKEFEITLFHLSDSIHINTEKTEAFFIYTCVGGEAALQYRAVKDDSEEGYTDNCLLYEGDSVLLPAEVQDFFIAPRAVNTSIIEVYIPHREEEDPYINKNTSPFLDGED